MSDFNNEIFEADDASFRHMNPARIAYIKPTGLEEARKQGIIPEGIQLPEGTRGSPRSSARRGRCLRVRRKRQHGD